MPNPTHHPRGDFDLSPQGQALHLPDHDGAPRRICSTIAFLCAVLFAPPWCSIAAGNPAGQQAPLAQQRVTASLYTSRRTDVGTPERLAQLNCSG